MTNKNLNITMIFMIFFMSLNLIAQNSIWNDKNLPYDNQVFTSNKTNNIIKVISILNSSNPIDWKNLDQFAAKYKDENISFIAITDKLTDYLNKEITDEILYYQQLSDQENKIVFNTYQKGMYKVFPIHIILNKEGEIIYKKKGNTSNIENKLAKKIDKLLKTYGDHAESPEHQYTVR